MEAYLLAMAKVLPVAEVSRQTSVSEDRLWHLIRARVDEAWKRADWGQLKRLGVDETSTRKGHKYGTVFLEINGKETSRGRGGSKGARLLYFTPGKDKETFSEFVAELNRRGVDPSQVEEIAMDMSKAFIAGAGEHFPDAQISFDCFHVMNLCGESLDEIRKQVVRENGSLPRGAMWALRGNPENLKEEQRQLRAQICKEHGKIARALSIRECLATYGTISPEATPSSTSCQLYPGAVVPEYSRSSNSARRSRDTWTASSATSIITQLRWRSKLSTACYSSPAEE